MSDLANPNVFFVAGAPPIKEVPYGNCIVVAGVEARHFTPLEDKHPRITQASVEELGVTLVAGLNTAIQAIITIQAVADRLAYCDQITTPITLYVVADVPSLRAFLWLLHFPNIADKYAECFPRKLEEGQLRANQARRPSLQEKLEKTERQEKLMPAKTASRRVRGVPPPFIPPPSESTTQTPRCNTPRLRLLSPDEIANKVNHPKQVSGPTGGEPKRKITLSRKQLPTYPNLPTREQLKLAAEQTLDLVARKKGTGCELEKISFRNRPHVVYTLLEIYESLDVEQVFDLANRLTQQKNLPNEIKAAAIHILEPPDDSF